MTTNCPYHTAPDQCSVIADLAGVSPIRGLTPGACEFCTAQAVPAQTVNEVTVSLAHGQEITPEACRALLAEHGHCLRHEMPAWATQAWSVATAVADWVTSGAHGVLKDVLQARLAVCDRCPNRDGHRCRKCGCFLRAKASLPGQDCPLGLWPKLSQT